jgi:hypothetical protein
MNKHLLLIIALLVAIIFLQRQCSSPQPTPEPTTIVDVDTHYVYKDTVITKYVTLVKTDTMWLPGDSVFIPDTCYTQLKIQFETLARSYSVRNIYLDTLLLDTFGFVILHDTIQYNRLKQHQYLLSYSIPVITKTVTLPPKRQLYAGGGLSVNTTLTSMTLQGGLLYKDKKDRVYGAHILTNGREPAQLGVSSYWKIRLK